MRNWAGNLTYSASGVIAPGSVEQIQEITRSARRVKALGTRHSFSGIADTDGVHVSTEKLNRVFAIDPEAKTVTIEGGIRYGELSGHLSAAGLALHNLASLPHISIAGACATATHGSGDRNGSLSTAVVAMDLVRGDGESITLRQGDPDFDAAVVNLGALGIVVRMTLQLEPTFTICQYVFEHLPWNSLERSFDEITSAAYSVSLFTDWSGDAINQVWLKSRESLSADDFFGARPAKEKLHPIRSMPADFCTDQLGVAGKWDERLSHFKMEFTPSSGEELQSEYLIDRVNALAALDALRPLAPEISPLLHISEVRTIARDPFWMSPFYERNSVGIHFTWRKDWERVRCLLPRIEAALEPFEPRPHWGKLSTMSYSAVRCRYPRADEFSSVRQRMDPESKFSSAFLDEEN